MGSVANTSAENEVPQGTVTTRPNSVALETLVTVTGARPSSEGARDLFTEETRTILVFVDGAVIQLASPVSEGQLLFLTNKKSNEEVVCQVLHKKVFGPSTCYVELQFTEEKLNYWGVALPKGKKRVVEFTAAEHVAGEQTTEQASGTAVSAPNEKDAENLKTQVEALRQQLAELEKKNAEESSAKAAAERAAVEEHATAEAAIREAEEAKASAAKAKRELDSANEAKTGDSGSGSLLMPPATAEKRPPGSTVKMALPTQPMEPRQARETESLPKPELDFSRVPQTANPDEIAARASLKGGGRREKLRMVGLAVVLAAVGFGAFEKLAPYVSSMTKKSGNSGGTATVPANPKPATTPKATPAAPVANAAIVAVGNSTAPERPNAPEAAPGKDEIPSNEVPLQATSNEVKENALAHVPKLEQRLGKTGSASKERAANRAAGKQNVTEAAPAEIATADAPLVPAKLLHGATPVYPPDAMRRYITGDVKAEVTVEASGKVVEIKVLSGPKALREAAVEALKRYEYAPATQGGKAVASNTTAVVKFWFNP